MSAGPILPRLLVGAGQGRLRQGGRTDHWPRRARVARWSRLLVLPVRHRPGTDTIFQRWEFSWA